MKGQEKGDCLLEVTTWVGFTVYLINHVSAKAICWASDYGYDLLHFGSFYCTTSILYYSDGEQTGFPFNELPKSICPPGISKLLCPSGLATLIPGKK